MTKFDYDQSKLDADELIDEFGQDIAIQRSTKSGPAYDPVLTDTDTPAVAAIVEYENSEIDGTLVLATDRKALVSVGNLTIEPTTDDKLVIGGAAYPIKSVMPLNPAGTVVMWTVQIAF